MEVFAVQNGITLVATLALFGVKAWAFIDAVSHRSDAFAAADKLTKQAWLLITGIFLAAFNTSANVSFGGTLTLDAIAAVLVGGTAIAGGRGSALRTLGGALLIAVIADVLLIRGYSTGAQILVKGLLVLGVVVLVHVQATRGRR